MVDPNNPNGVVPIGTQPTPKPTSIFNATDPSTGSSVYVANPSLNPQFNYNTPAPKIATTPVGAGPAPSPLVNPNANWYGGAPLTGAPQAGISFTPPSTNTAQGTAQFVTNNIPTPNGGSITTNGTGTPTNFSPATPFSVGSTGSVPSSALNGTGSVPNSYSQYSDYVNALSSAQGYSPAYIQAQQGVFANQAQDAALQENQLSGQGFAGATADYAANVTNRARSQNAIEGLASQQALDVQQLARTGNIAAAQTQLQYSPVGMVGQQAIAQYQQLGQLYPGANIPPFNPQLDPQAQLQTARQLVAQSPAYQAGFQSTYQTPGGGTGIYSKLNMNGFTQNPDGSLTLVPAAAAALGAANAGVVQQQVTNLSNINSAISASGKTIDTMTQFMNQYGLNQANVPIVNQIMNSANAQLPKAGALAALKIDLNTLRSDYAQFLIGRGGSIAGTNDEANSTIPDNISPAQLQIVYSQMKQDGLNTAGAVSDQVNQALQGISTNTSASTSGAAPTTGVSSGWNF